MRECKIVIRRGGAPPRFHPALFVVLLALGILLASSVRAVAGEPPAPTPPMGWNSWDAYGTTVREQQLKANADVMARDLVQYGWRYVVVDIQWPTRKLKAALDPSPNFRASRSPTPDSGLPLHAPARPPN